MRLSFTAILVRAVASTLPRHPYLNASLDGDQIILGEDVQVGVATSIEDYLIVPVIREAQSKDLEQIGDDLGDLVERARAKLEDTGYAAALCGEAFTVADLHAVYEAVWGVSLDRANFHRKVTGVAGFLTPTRDRREGGRGRPARVYRADPWVVLSPPILRADR